MFPKPSDEPTDDSVFVEDVFVKDGTSWMTGGDQQGIDRSVGEEELLLRTLFV